MKIPKDKRNKLWPVLEAEIQKGASKKDKKFILKGKWKKFYRSESGLKVYKVDGMWVRTNLSIIFGHGGHGLVHEFIPHNEIWINTHHPKSCGCKKVRKDRKMSPAYTKSTTLHEITEYKEMKKGKKFWPAHNMALQAERHAGFLLDPYTEKY
ncbi:hypothetical protein KW785_03415 [Candidatus Parcubacteria bacterium]|nr:hypothetical protein [Candidatus Parcubacteria bacterium]